MTLKVCSLFYPAMVLDAYVSLYKRCEVRKKHYTQWNKRC